jgi:hypothetical protein
MPRRLLPQIARLWPPCYRRCSERQGRGEALVSEWFVSEARHHPTGRTRCRAGSRAGQDPDKARGLFDALDIDAGKVRKGGNRDATHHMPGSLSHPNAGTMPFPSRNVGQITDQTVTVGPAQVDIATERKLEKELASVLLSR